MRKQYLLLALIVMMQIASSIIVWYSLDKTTEMQVWATDMWMLLNALSWVCAFLIIALLSTGLFRTLIVIVCFMWATNVIDELFFDPTLPQWNDIAALVIAENIAVVAIVKNHFRKK